MGALKKALKKGRNKESKLPQWLQEITSVLHCYLQQRQSNNLFIIINRGRCARDSEDMQVGLTRFNMYHLFIVWH